MNFKVDIVHWRVQRLRDWMKRAVTSREVATWLFSWLSQFNWNESMHLNESNHKDMDSPDTIQCPINDFNWIAASDVLVLLCNKRHQIVHFPSLKMERADEERGAVRSCWNTEETADYQMGNILLFSSSSTSSASSAPSASSISL